MARNDYAVCLVQPTLFPEASRVDIYEYSRALARQGIKTNVIVSKDVSAGVPEQLAVHALGTPTANTPWNWMRFAFGARRVIRRLAVEQGLGIVHLFNPSPATYLLGWLLKSGIQAEKSRPKVVYDLRTGGLGHGPDALLTNAMARTAERFSDCRVALSAELGRRLLGPSAPFREIPLGVNLESFQVRAPAEREPSSFVFVYAGTLSRNRRLLSMLEAFEEVARLHSEARLVVAGDGDDRERLERFARARGLDRSVSFLGKLPYAKIPQLLARADCGLAYVPDEPWFQPQPQLKTLEYLASGLPVVAVRTAGNRQLWQGLPPQLLTADDAGAFAAGMRYAIGHRQALLPGDFRMVAERFSWERITRERLLPLYEELMGHPPGGAQRS